MFVLYRNVFWCSLEVRVPLLDHHLTSYYLSLPASMRCPQQGIEKYLLRKAFDGTGLLPPEILWRPKVAFSDGLSSAEKPWYESLQEFACQEVNTKVPFYFISFHFIAFNLVVKPMTLIEVNLNYCTSYEPNREKPF